MNAYQVRCESWLIGSFYLVSVSSHHFTTQRPYRPKSLLLLLHAHGRPVAEPSADIGCQQKSYEMGLSTVTVI